MNGHPTINFHNILQIMRGRGGGGESSDLMTKSFAIN